MTAKRYRPLTAAEMGKKGGKARWKGVSAGERSEITRQAVRARWVKETAKRKSRASQSVAYGSGRR